MRAFTVAVALFAAAVSAQPALGETTFANSGAAKAQEPFLRGLLLLHSFEYDDARDAFRQARQLDPGFAMAAWGEAMTHNHPIWQRQDRDAARAALAGVTADDETLREAAYLTTLAVLFGDGEKEDRDDRYAEAMRQLAADYPDDLDARAFYALALLGTAHEGRDAATYAAAAEAAQSVLDRAPEHPGALHYLIHAYDDPQHAARALPAAVAYARVAADASHALHMPTHIFFALGMWDAAIELNHRSMMAAEAASERHGEPLNNHGWHALYWYHYALLQLDRDEDDPNAYDSALILLDAAHVLYQADPSPMALRHLVRMRAQTAASVPAAARAARTVFGLRPDLPVRDADPATQVVDAEMRAMETSVGDAELDSLAAHVQRLAAEPDAPASVRASFLATIPYGQGGPGRPSREEETEVVVRGLVRSVEIIEATPISFGPPVPVVLPHEELAGMVLANTHRFDVFDCLLDAVEARAPGRLETRRLRQAVGRHEPVDEPRFRVPELSFCPAPADPEARPGDR